MHAVCAGGGELRDRLAGGGKVPPLFSGHIAGGTHHAFWDRGEGFCVFSDIAVSRLYHPHKIGSFVYCSLWFALFFFPFSKYFFEGFFFFFAVPLAFFFLSEQH